MRSLAVAVPHALALSLAGCMGSGGGASPEDAVVNFLQPFTEAEEERLDEGEPPELWRLTVKLAYDVRDPYTETLAMADER